MLTADDVRTDEAQRVYAEHQPAPLFGDQAWCRRCSHLWPCPDVRLVLPTLLDDENFQL